MTTTQNARLGEVSKNYDNYNSQIEKLRTEVQKSINQIRSGAKVTISKINGVQLSKSSHLTELLLAEKKLEASYKLEKIQIELKDIELNAKA